MVKKLTPREKTFLDGAVDRRGVTEDVTTNKKLWWVQFADGQELTLERGSDLVQYVITVRDSPTSDYSVISSSLEDLIQSGKISRPMARRLQELM